MKHAHREYIEGCRGCRPCVVDPVTGEVLADDSPVMHAINALWDKNTTRTERQAFFRVTVLNSRSAIDVGICQGLMERIQVAMKTAVQ